MQALQRRAIAVDMGDFVLFETGDLWVQVLIAAKGTLPGFSAVTMHQLRMVDEEL